MGRITLINNVFSDLLTLCDELQSIFYDSTLGMSTNKYINYLNDSILGGLFKTSCSIGRFFLNYIYLPKARIEVLEFIPKFNVPLLEILSDKNKSTWLFVFIDNKISNIMNAIDKGELYKKLPEEFGEFTSMSKIMNGTILPQIIADQYLSWKPRLSTNDNPFKGNIIKYLTNISDKTGKEKEEDQFMKKYTSDISYQKNSNLQGEAIESTNIILGTDSEYNNYDVLNLEEIQKLLRNLANDSAVILDIIKNKKSVKKEITDNSGNILYEIYETDKQIYIPSKNMIYDINFDSYGKKILDTNGNTTYDEKNGHLVSQNIPELMNDPTMMEIIEEFTPDKFTYKYSNFLEDILTYNTRESNILTDYSVTNVFYYYYVNLFMEEKQKQKNTSGKDTSGNDFNIEDFKKWLLNQTSITMNDDQNKLDATGIKVAIMNNILLSLDTRKTDQSRRWWYVSTQNKFEVLPKMTIPKAGMQTLTKFIDDLSVGKYTDRSKSSVNENFMLNTTKIDKAELIYRNAYMGVNLRHSYGYSPILVKARDFLSTAELLLALNNDEANDQKTLTDKLAEIENMSLNEPQINILLNDLNKLYSEPIQKISSNLNTIINDFKTNFCNEQNGKCDSENTVPMKHLLFDYPEFKTKLEELLSDQNSVNDYKTKILEAYENPYIVQYLKDHCEIKFKCSVQNTVTNVSETIYLNKNGINMDNGDMADENCLQTMKNSPVDFSKVDDFLNILLRPEVFFQLSQYKKDENAYNKIRKDIFNNHKINKDKSNTNRSLYRNKFKQFFETIQNITQNGVKKEKDKSTIVSLFDVINEVIEEQKKKYDTVLDVAVQNVKADLENIKEAPTGDINFWEEVQKKLPQPTQSIETLEKMYYKNFKLKTLFKFGVILKDMKKRTIDPQVKNTLINYFSQKESILDKSAVFEEQINKVNNILQKIPQICGENENKTAIIKKDLSVDLKKLKNLYDTDNIKGQINLTLNKTDNSRLDLTSFGITTNDPYIENKKREFTEFEEEFQKIRFKLIMLSGRYHDLFWTESIICKKNDNDVNQYEILPVVEEYFDKRNDWIKHQNELFKLYILYNSNNYYSGFANNYDHFFYII